MRIVTAFSGLLVAIALLVIALLATVHADPARFDNLVRADFFAGFRGDAARLALGMKRCEDALAADPAHPDALVWHGSGLLFLSGRAFADNDFDLGTERFNRGLDEMDRAARLAPDSLPVILVRAATLNTAAPAIADRALARRLQRSAVDAYEHALSIQAPRLAQLSTHSRGELLAGLAEGWSRLGETERARGYLQRIVAEVPGSPYQARARAWLEDGVKPPLTCLGCHRP